MVHDVDCRLCGRADQNKQACACPVQGAAGSISKGSAAELFEKTFRQLCQGTGRGQSCVGMRNLVCRRPSPGGVGRGGDQPVACRLCRGVGRGPRRAKPGQRHLGGGDFARGAPGFAIVGRGNNQYPARLVSRRIGRGSRHLAHGNRGTADRASGDSAAMVFNAHIADYAHARVTTATDHARSLAVAVTRISASDKLPQMPRAARPMRIHDCCSGEWR